MFAAQARSALLKTNYSVFFSSLHVSLMTMR